MTIYKRCYECGHVWETEKEFRKDVETIYTQMNKYRKPDDPEMIVPNNLDNECVCPLCTHDL